MNAHDKHNDTAIQDRKKANKEDSLVVVTVLIPDVVRCTTGAFDGIDALVALNYEGAVQAFAFLTVGIIVRPAAITTVPVATSVVVLVIAVLVAFPFFLTTFALHGLDTSIALVLELAVQALAVFAIFVVVPLTTTIATVPVTRTIVVLVVAVFIAFILRFPTLALAYAAISFFDFLHKCRVQTSTL